MAETNTNTANSTEDQAKKVSKIKALFHSIAQFIKDLSNHNSIVDRMEKLENELDKLVEDSDINDEALDELYSLTNKMAGKLDTITAENREQILTDWQDEVEKAISKCVVRDAEDGKDKDLIVSIKQGLETLTGVPRDENFETEFCSKAKIISCGDLKENDFLLIEIDKQILKASFTIPEEGEKPHIEFDIQSSDYDYDDIFDQKGVLKEDFSYTASIGNNALHSLYSAACEANGLHYVIDKEKEIKRLQKQLSPKGLFLQSRTTKDTLSNDGRYISRFFPEDNSFRIRDTKTGDMVSLKTTASTIDIQLYNNTTSFNINGEGFYLGGWQDKGEGVLESRLATFKGNADISTMLRCKEMRQFLFVNGVSEENQKAAFQHKADTDWSKVSPEHKHKVEELQTSCYKVVSHLNDEYYIEMDDTEKSKYTFLNIYDKDENRLSFTFKADGSPHAINYRKAGYKQKTMFMYNVETKCVSAECADAYDDIAFRKLFMVAKEALGEEKAYEKTDAETAKKADEKVKISQKERD